MPSKKKPAAAAEAEATGAEVPREQLLMGYLGHKELGKAHYTEADKCLLALIEATHRKRASRTIIHPETGDAYMIVDNFADNNVAFGHGAVRRFDLKPVKKPKC